MYKDGWWLSMKTARIPWVLTPEAIKPYTPGVWDPDQDPTELYYLPDDFSRAHDLAAQHPEKVKELQELFWQEAEKYNVLPLMATLAGFFGMVPPLPETARYEFRGDVQNVLSGMIPRIYNHSYTITAELVIPPGGAEGVIVAEADHLGGFSLFVDGGKLTHTYSMMGVFVFRHQAEESLPDGEVTVRMEFAADAAKPATGGEVTPLTRATKKSVDASATASPALSPRHRRPRDPDPRTRKAALREQVRAPGMKRRWSSAPTRWPKSESCEYGSARPA